MLKHEIEKRIEKIEEERFYLAMKDHWTREDFDKDREYLREINKLKKDLTN